MKIHSYVFHYNRPRLLAQCVSDLSLIGSVKVVDDHSRIRPHNAIQPVKHCGRTNFNCLWQLAFDNATGIEADWFIFAQDDFTQWNLPALKHAIDYCGKHRVLHYHRDHREAVWNNFQPQQLDETYRRIGWVDAHYAISKWMLSEVMNYTVPVVTQSWKKLGASSGVGKYTTEFFKLKGVEIIQPVKSICHHAGNGCSVMHPIERLNNPLKSI